MEERGVEVDHSTLNRWVVKYVPLLDQQFRTRKCLVGSSWRLDETYVKVKGSWKYLYRAVDKTGATVDFLLTARRDRKAALRFLRKAIGHHGVPEKITIDESGANKAAIESYNAEHQADVEIRQVKYLNNILEHDHRAVKRVARPTLGFKSFRSAQGARNAGGATHAIDQCASWTFSGDRGRRGAGVQKRPRFSGGHHNRGRRDDSGLHARGARSSRASTACLGSGDRAQRSIHCCDGSARQSGAPPDDRARIGPGDGLGDGRERSGRLHFLGPARVRRLSWPDAETTLVRRQGATGPHFEDGQSIFTEIACRGRACGPLLPQATP
jgi:putative transposase